MRKLILFSAISALQLFNADLKAQGVVSCQELFMSEYIEGSRNNKAIEIYNPTTHPIDLSQYRLTRWQNGSATWDKQYSDALSGTIQPQDVVVLVLDRRDTTQIGIDTPVVEELRLKADLFLSKDYNTSYSMSFNGDDAMSLDKWNEQYSTWLLVDIMGKIGERPPSVGWSDSFPYNKGLGTWYTANRTLIRKYQVLTGCDTIAPIKRGLTATAPQAWNPQYFDPSAEWDIHPRDMFDSLGVHGSGCKTLSGERISIVPAVKLYPNPVDGQIYLETTVAVERFEVLNAFGQVIAQGSFSGAIDAKGLISGMYFLNLTLKDGQMKQERFIKN
ncbi:MAG: lamin tail domain-containing protein [Bacteroidia bacterium]|nr:lamin tail domain-containing protein [Bacteroidia bacterium]